MASIYTSTVHIPTYSGEICGTLSYKNPDNGSVAVLLLADAGAIDRNGNSIDGHNQSDCLNLIARDLASIDICTLRYDKRGVKQNKSPASYTDDITFDDYVEDAVHAVFYLKKELNFDKVIVAGHGEGALVGTLAAQHAPVDGLISIAATAKNAAQLLHDQLKRRLSGPQAMQAKRIIEQLYEGRFVDALPEAFETLFNHQQQPYLISLFRYHPNAEIKKLNIPIMLLHGNRDLHIPCSDASTLKINAPAALVQIIDGMNHVLKQVDASTDIQLDYYRDASISVSQFLIAYIMAFTSRVTGQHKETGAKSLEMSS